MVLWNFPHILCVKITRIPYKLRQKRQIFLLSPSTTSRHFLLLQNFHPLFPIQPPFFVTIGVMVCAPELNKNYTKWIFQCTIILFQYYNCLFSKIFFSWSLPLLLPFQRFTNKHILLVKKGILMKPQILIDTVR